MVDHICFYKERFCGCRTWHSYEFARIPEDLPEDIAQRLVEEGTAVEANGGQVQQEPVPFSFKVMVNNEPVVFYADGTQQRLTFYEKSFKENFK